jgi:hypothetical protein
MQNPARHYAARLFQVQYNLILLGGAASFSLASASPWPMIVAFGFELAWLGVCSRLPAFQRWADSRDARALEVESHAVTKGALEGLASEYSSRALAIEHGLGELRVAKVAVDSPDATRTQQRLATIGAAFVEMCRTHQRLGSVVHAMPEAELNEEVQRLRQAFTAEKDLGLRLGIKQSIALAQGRLEERRNLMNTRRNLGLRLAAVERTIADLRAQARAVGLSAPIAAELGALITEITADAQAARPSDDFPDVALPPTEAAVNSGV